jgi:hypothetical protein
MNSRHRHAVLDRLAGCAPKSTAEYFSVSVDTVRRWLRLHGFRAWGGYILDGDAARRLRITPEDARTLGAEVFPSGAMASRDARAGLRRAAVPD